MTRAPGFGDLFAAFPLRTLLLSVTPLVLALVQGVNGVLYGGNLVLVAGFAAVMVAFSVGTTRHQLSAFRVRALEDRFLD